MTTLALSVTLTRNLLNLPVLQINDGVRYKVAPNFLGGAQSWNRQQVTSAWMDGAVTVNRTRQQVQEPVGVEVYGRLVANGIATAAVLAANEAELLAAFEQDNFTITVVLGSGDAAVTTAYAAEAADLQSIRTGDRLRALQSQVQFTMPRQPVPLIGAL